jgi:hypothetical protein
VNELGASKELLDKPARFTTFNGDPMTTEWETTLSFREEMDKVTIRATFLVAVSGHVPFDMVLGAKDIRRYELITQKSIFGLVNDKQNKGACCRLYQKHC